MSETIVKSGENHPVNPETVTDHRQWCRRTIPGAPVCAAVDDEENFLTLLNWFLTQRGYQVYTASHVKKHCASPESEFSTSPYSISSLAAATMECSYWMN